MKIGNRMKIIAASFALAIALAGAAGVGYASNGAVKLDAYYGVKILKDGKEVTAKDTAPFIVDGTAYIPVRALEGMYGEKVRWDEARAAVVLTSAAAGGRELPPASSIGGDATRVNVKTNVPMSIGGKDMGNAGFYVDQYAWGQKTILTYDLNKNYAALDLSIGLDDRSNQNAVRTVQFADDADRSLLQTGKSHAAAAAAAA